MKMPHSLPTSLLPVVIVLAAGRGERFVASGGDTHKLAALLAGKPVLDHVLAAVQGSGLSFHVVEADASRPGMGDSIAAGVCATADASGWMILPGDLPLIRSETLLQVAQAPESAVLVPMYGGQKGHPVRFSSSCRGALSDLRGNQGAAHLVREMSAINSVAYLALNDVGIVTDIDTLEDLTRAEQLLAARRR
ncbi:MAG TPA: nucleotidyltransferase family protein [Polaromonas sp.]|uniref:nucleotidyltransferase family protein n=1 Tax=Polaromonas sp. TaxID=1869339 RepID=UPI002D4FC834|nr:nucleotidyltransferase family protein [Polaromonas sp.]HYW56066.1 nucleotidyltransferase family protein [Polaromonas sp.]